MEPDFWNQRWAANKIGFHEGETNALLVRHLGKLSLKQNSRVFLPLCGKTRDIAWLISQGFRVAGIELNLQAVEQLFKELGVAPDIVQIGNLQHFRGQNIDVFAGDIFDLTSQILGPVDAVYDRAALVALPPKMRKRYSEHLINITNNAPQFLVCFDYDQSQMNGPPFSINATDVKLHYQHCYDITLIDSVDVTHGLSKQVPATETVWLLHKQTD